MTNKQLEAFIEALLIIVENAKDKDEIKTALSAIQKRLNSD